MEQKSTQTQEFDDIQGIKEPGVKKNRNVFKSVLDGSFMGKDQFLDRMPYILFLVGIGIAYITNTYHAENLLRERKKLELEMRELHPEAISISSQLMQMSNQTEVAHLCKENGLEMHENLDPPYKIVLKPQDVKFVNRKVIDK
ncbi:MAG: FtsL-like putative cell division protein [Salinivirgaceae bacterium]|jgi:hypothetical protein|nr:FtsL-like putative cell division protein [Salinivirgaceae bacterium]MDD4747904.1 FtsL-like putative cell division protein [Salinivirgaceae bacterium]MDY0279760.1 FtsL-like putative cell division protein [Salinivirgaceae bacterium]